MEEPTIDQVEAALLRVCLAPNFGGQTRGRVPSRWVTLVCVQTVCTHFRDTQSIVLKHLKSLEKKGIAIRVPGNRYHNGLIYSNWWHPAAPIPNQPE